MTKALTNYLRIPFRGEKFLDDSLVKNYSKLMENASYLFIKKKMDFFDYGDNVLRNYSDKESETQLEEELDEKKDYAFINTKNAKKININLSNYAKMFNEKCAKIESEYFLAVEKTNEERKKLNKLEREADELKNTFYSKFGKKNFFEKIKSNLCFWKGFSKEEIENNKEKLLLENKINHSLVELKTQKIIFENQNKYALSLQKDIKELKRTIDETIKVKNNLSDVENFYKNYLESFHMSVI